MVSPRPIRQRLFAPILVVVAALVVGAAPACASPSGDPYYGPHTGYPGVHTLIDNRNEQNGVTCVYQPSGSLLHKLKIRRPIVFAYDRTGGVDNQWVAWKFIVEYADVVTAASAYNDWDNLFGSSWVKAKATDDIAASWSPRSFTFTSVDHNFYRVSIVMKWYHPYPSKTHVNGSALDVVHWYQWNSPTFGTPTYEDYCRAHDD